MFFDNYPEIQSLVIQNDLIKIREYFENKDNKTIEPVSSLPLPDNKKTSSLVKPNVPSDTVPVSAETVKTASIPNNVNATPGLTRIEDALLSNTEKAIKLGTRRRVT